MTYVGVIYRHWIVLEDVVKCYIGKHEGLDVERNRWGRDGCRYRPKPGAKATHFWSAISKYGWHSFNHDIILKIECDTQEELTFWLTEWEKYYIWYYDSYNNGYNMTLGGDGFTSETSLRLWKDEKYRNDRRQGTLKLWQDDEYRQRQIDTHTTLEYRQCMIRHMGKRVVCLQTGQIFNSIREAADWCGMTDSSDGDIGRCCKGKRKTAGKHPETGEKLTWMFYEDYINI